MQLDSALSFVEQRRQALAEDSVRHSPAAATTVPHSGQVKTMFGEGHSDSIVQPGIDEALACRDMLLPAPAQPSPLAGLMARLVAAVRAISRRGTAGERRVTPVAHHVTR